jgi:mannose-6-phosphate isomerase-like protein (cupin superfamily)
MELTSTREELGIQVAAPFSRSIKVLFAPDRLDVDELTFSVVLIDVGNGTDNHVHDRPELIYIVAGTGEAVVEGQAYALATDMALLVRTGEWHLIRNTGTAPLKMATVFVPGIRAEDNYRRCLDAAAAGAAAEA